MDRSISRSALLMVWCALFSACGGGGAPPAVPNSISAAATLPDGHGLQFVAGIQITRTSASLDLRAKDESSGYGVDLHVYPSPSVPGTTYVGSDASYVELTWPQPVGNYSGATGAGTITFTKLALAVGSAVEGTFQAMLKDGSVLSGSFNGVMPAVTN